MTSAVEPSDSSHARSAALAILVLTVVQLGVAVAVPSLTQFAGKGFGARLLAYPALMLALPAAWALVTRLRTLGGSSTPDLPWAGVAWVMAPFLVDVTGNSLDLYDAVAWWDDVNHLVNWFLLAVGFGLVLLRLGVRDGWLLVLVLTGWGALLAVGWELGEYVVFIRAGTELEGAYTDTLGDEALGTLGALLAAVVVTRWARGRRTRGPG